MAQRLLSSLLALSFYLFGKIEGIQITGATGGINLATGERPSRQEINYFATSGPAYDLFILALIRLQNTDQSDPLSYFQISGIHGYPHIPWDGVVGTGPYPGYCTHSAVVFPTWHRPYMALYEQVIWTNAHITARSYPPTVRDQYIAAALTLRIPHWDWAAYPYLPDAVTQPHVSINSPEGIISVKNPLFSYIFLDSPQNEGFPLDFPMANMTQTVRYWNPVSRQQNQSEANEALLSQAPTILSLVYQLFTLTNDYTSFSCTWARGIQNPGNNIESIHNSIHNSVGGLGHMQYPEVAAFDPIFMLHHANVDRIFAMWQVLNPESYIVPTLNTYGSYYELPGQFVDSGNSSLAPFHSDNGTTLFTSDDVRSTRALGYTYPELLDWSMTADELASSLRSKINFLYNPNAFSSNNGSLQISTAQHRRLARTKSAATAHAFDHINFHEAKKAAFNNLDTTWIIDIRLQLYAYNGPFTIDFFMGDIPSDPACRGTAANLIGSYSQFIMSNGASVSMLLSRHGNKSTSRPSGLTRGSVSLSHTLAGGLSRGILTNLTPREIVPLLSAHLQWAVRDAEGNNINVASLKNLSVAVSSRAILRQARRPDEFPVYGKLRWWPNITKGKVGGWAGGEIEQEN